jgi:hypothetical protein
LADEKVAELIKQKREYLETYQPEEKIPAQLRIEKWRQFMPPIVRFEMGDVAPIAKEFLEDLERLVKTENRNQRGQIGVIHGKIKQYTYGIIEAINRIVAEEQPLMKTAGGVPFLENSCCSGTPPGHDVLLYFANKNHAIAKYVEQSARLEDIVRKINMKPPILFAPPSGRAGIQEIPANFDNKELIYGAFIHYCRLDVDVPAPPELLAISPRKIEGMKSSWSIQEKILFMENNGVKLTREKLETLMALVGARNRAIAAPAAPTTAAAAATPDPEDEFDFLKKELVFVEKLYNASADGATAADSMNLRIYVEKVTTNDTKSAAKEISMYRTIRAFLEKNSVSTRDYNMFSAFLAGAQFENWKTPTQGAMFYENAILYMTKIIPGVFLNGDSPTDKVKIPKHWDLSSQHNHLL